jgi:hypothetical protein
LALIAGTAVLLSVAVIGQVVRGTDFLSGRLQGLAQMEEVKGIVYHLSQGEFRNLQSDYSALLWLVPFTVAALCWRLRRRAGDADIFFCVMCVAGLLLMLQQYRLENYGSFTLYLPACCLVEDALRRWPARRWLTAGAAAAIACAAYIPAYGELLQTPPPGSSYDYQMTMGIYPPMAKACARQPGAVLADYGDGHFITYHTQCSVLADNFIISAYDERKILEAESLLHSSLAEVMSRAPYVRYLYLRRQDNVFQSTCGLNCSENRGLRAELLGTTEFPPAVTLLAEIRIQGPGGTSEPLARLFAVNGQDPVALAPSSDSRH